MSTANRSQQRSPRLHQEDWLQHALETLRKEGVGGLRVEPLARSLGVTTGSFYWHFEDRRDLLDRVLGHWADSMTRAIARRMTSQEDPDTQLESLLGDVIRDDRSRYEIPVRNWANFDEQAAKAVRKVDECRLAYVNGLFLQLGFSEEQAAVRSRMFIFYLLGGSGFSVDDSVERRLELATELLDILLTDYTRLRLKQA